ncbi:MAG: AraC family transcriptional regulator [Symplocastrum torsivum CPER-KK1]|uniref:AraC family transcriptional regulator n=1 Tax=Symplocastrum torsivum CPER-KK1 TaxID=450513 RepID=A0A951PQK0_9CYAN|nr:AraC family transcriptional regulator [Symplocastrum torsivum CPER-KK1]
MRCHQRAGVAITPTMPRNVITQLKSVLTTQRPQETAKFWRDPALDNLEMLRATYLTQTFSRHTHDGYAIGAVEAGVLEFTYQGSVHRAPAGSIVIIHPGEVHTGHTGTQNVWTYRMLYPEILLVQKAATELVKRSPTLPYFPNPVIQNPHLAAQLRQLHILLETSTSVLERESRFLWMLAQLLARYAQCRSHIAPLEKERQIVQRVQDYLIANYMHSISLEQLAGVANLKPLRLLRVFRKHVGLPPHAYLVQTRVAYAKALLSLGLPICHVAADTGFTDQSHLTRHFKRLVGVTPKQYALGCGNNVQDFQMEIL